MEDLGVNWEDNIWERESMKISTALKHHSVDSIK